MDRETIQFVRQLKRYRGKLHKQTIKTLRGQALSGNLKGAKLGLEKVLEKGVDASD